MDDWGLLQMARINIEDSIYKDFRFMNLVMKLGSVDHAIGSLVRAWSLAQDYFLDESTNGMVPVKAWEKQGINNLLLEVGLAEAHENLIKVSGSEEQFAWLTQKAAAGIKSGEVRRLRSKSNGCSTDGNERSTGVNGNEPLTLSPTHSLTQNPKSINPDVGDVRSAQQKPLEDLVKSAKGKVKLDDVMELYNQILAGTGKLKHVRGAGEDTRRNFLNSLDDFPTIDHWKVVFESVKKSKKLTGQVPNTWLGTFSWVVKKENAHKIEQGAYDDDFSDVSKEQIDKNLSRLELK